MFLFDPLSSGLLLLSTSGMNLLRMSPKVRVGGLLVTSSSDRHTRLSVGSQYHFQNLHIPRLSLKVFKKVKKKIKNHNS